MISIFVITPRVLFPSLSISIASLSPSEVEISALAGITTRIIVLSSYAYLEHIFLVNFSISTPYCASTEIRVIPGKSTKVRSGHSLE